MDNKQTQTAPEPTEGVHVMEGSPACAFLWKGVITADYNGLRYSTLGPTGRLVARDVPLYRFDAALWQESEELARKHGDELRRLRARQRKQQDALRARATAITPEEIDAILDSK